MIVKSYITVCTNLRPDAVKGNAIARLRWLCEALIGDGILSEEILTAAQTQSGLNCHTANDQVTTLWARRLVIKDCIGTMRPGESIGLSTTWLDTTPRDGHLPAEMRMATDDLRVRLGRLSVLPRFVFVLTEIEGLPCGQVAVLLNVSEALCAVAYSAAVQALRSSIAPIKRCCIHTHLADTQIRLTEA